LYERVVASATTDEPVQYCTLDEPVDLPAALEAAAIEHLDVEFWKESPDKTRNDEYNECLSLKNILVDT